MTVKMSLPQPLEETSDSIVVATRLRYVKESRPGVVRAVVACRDVATRAGRSVAAFLVMFSEIAVQKAGQAGARGFDLGNRTGKAVVAHVESVILPACGATMVNCLRAGMSGVELVVTTGRNLPVPRLKPLVASGAKVGLTVLEAVIPVLENILASARTFLTSCFDGTARVARGVLVACRRQATAMPSVVERIRIRTYQDPMLVPVVVAVLLVLLLAGMSGMIIPSILSAGMKPR